MTRQTGCGSDPQQYEEGLHPEFLPWLTIMHDDDYTDDNRCPTCGGDGIVEYLDCPEAWGEDCPSEENHLITCPNCRGSGLLKDCTTC